MLPFRRVLPYANAQKAFSLLGATLRNHKNKKLSKIKNPN
jgi:hypothetical protein